MGSRQTTRPEPVWQGKLMVNAPQAGRGESKTARRAWAIRVFLTCWVLYTVSWTPWIVREHFPAITLAESGQLDVARYRDWTEDIFSGPHGGAYINNNPGASLAGAVPLLLLRPILARVDAWNQQLPRHIPQNPDDPILLRMAAEGRTFYFLLVAFVTVALLMAPATAFAIALLCKRMIEAGIPASHSASVSLLCGLATPLIFRTGHLNHNLLAGDAGLIALLLLWDPADKPLSPTRAASAGLLAGYAVLCDYSGVVIVAVTALYVGLRSSGDSPARWKCVAAYLAGLVPGIAGLFLYQQWAFGSFYHPSQQYMTPTAPTAHGYRGFTWPSPALLWVNFFDPRFGLFPYCPALLLAVLAPFAKQAGQRMPSREMRLIAVYCSLFIVFCAANQYSWLQPSTGFRYLVPIVPVLALAAIQGTQLLPRILQWGIAIASLAWSLVLAAAHENDVRLAVQTLWSRRFALPWMIRLRAAGVPVSWEWVLATYLITALAIVTIWAGPVLRRRRGGRVGELP
ncbi:MAG: hypothetical protein ABR987_09765 [Terracidiphilus sp.]|jgi:hypothetical protein